MFWYNAHFFEEFTSLPVLVSQMFYFDKIKIILQKTYYLQKYNDNLGGGGPQETEN